MFVDTMRVFGHGVADSSVSKEIPALDYIAQFHIQQNKTNFRFFESSRTSIKSVIIVIEKIKLHSND